MVALEHGKAAVANYLIGEGADIGAVNMVRRKYGLVVLTRIFLQKKVRKCGVALCLQRELRWRGGAIS